METEEPVRLHPRPGDARAGVIFCSVGAVAGLALAATSLVVGDLWSSVLLGSGSALAAIFGGVALLCGRAPGPGQFTLELTPIGLREDSVGSSRAFEWADFVGFGVMDESEGGPVVSFRFSESYRSRRPHNRFGHGRAPDGVLNETYGKSARELADLLDDWRRQHAAAPL